MSVAGGRGRRAHRRLVGAGLVALVLAPAGLVATAVPAFAATATTTTITTAGTSTYYASASLTVTVTATSGNPTTGRVVISDSFGDFSCSVTLSGTNQAVCDTGYSAVGTDTITATYDGTSSYGPSTGTASVDVSPATVTLSASATAATVGETTTVTIESTPALGANRTGTLTVSDTLGALSCDTTLANGASALCTSSSFPGTGTDKITASWAGNADYNPAGATTTLAVTAASTLVASVTAPASQVGQNATITVAVSPHPDGGDVEITDADGQVTGCSSVPVDTSTGQATCTTGTLVAADPSDALSARYLGDTNYAASPVAGGALEVNRGTTQLAVTASPAPSVGATATYVATLSPSAASAGGGSVAFSDTSSKLTDCAAQPLSPTTGSASCQSLTYSSVGTDTVSASYGGSTNWAPSSGSQAFNVSQGQPNLTVSVSPTQLSVGEQATITAVVSPTDGGGTVAFSGADISGCTAVALSGNSASCTTSTFTSTGSYGVQITYSGDSNFRSVGPNTYGNLISVTAAPTTLALTSSPSSPVAFAADTLSATVSPVPDGGTVAFSDSGGLLAGCSAVAVSTTTGIATCVVSRLPGAGPDNLTAGYSGDSNYLSAIGHLSLGVQKVPTTVLVAASPATLTVGHTATITITVSPVPDGGTATVSDSFGDLSCSNVAIATSGTGAGTATCVTRSLSPAGSDTLSASFTGTSNYASATGSGSIVVDRILSTTQVTLADAFGIVGQPLHLSVTVSPAPTSGTVDFSDALAQLGVSASVPVDPSSGVATCSSGALTRTGPDSITATFEQTGTESSSSASTSIPIDEAPAFSGSLALTESVASASSAVLQASGYPAPVVRAATPLPSGLSLEPNGTVAGTPGFGTGGVYEIPVTATNSLASASATMTLVIDQAPSISSPTSLQAAYGTETSFLVTTSPGTYPTATFALSGALPSGMTFTDNRDGTATVSGTPDNGVSGRQDFSLVVTNAAGSSVVAFAIDVTGTPAPASTVVPPAPAPVSSPAASPGPAPAPSSSPTPAPNVASLSPLAEALALHRSEAVPSAGRQPRVGVRGALPATFDPIAPIVTVRRHHKLVKVQVVTLGPDRRFPVLGNVGPYGDCAVVADSNIVRVDHLLGRLAKVPAMTANEALSEWSAINGGTGAGLTDAQFLHAWAGPAGVLGTRIRGWRRLDVENIAAIKRAVRASGAIYAGIVLPSSGVVGTTIDPSLGATTPVSGHGLAIFGWTRKGLLGVSWGQVVLIPYGWWRRYSTTAYALDVIQPALHKVAKKPARRAP